MELSRKIVLSFSSEEEAVLAGAVLSEAAELDALPFVTREEDRGWAIDCYDDGSLGDGGAAHLFGLLESAGVAPKQAPALEIVPQADWVSLTQKGLPPVQTGRFLIHGSHDRGKAATRSRWAIEIDAGRAFGTAHHGSTKGCLLAIDRLSRLQHRAQLRNRRHSGGGRHGYSSWPALSRPSRGTHTGVSPSRLDGRARPGHDLLGRKAARGDQTRSILDLGTGSGILAIAAVKTFSFRCLALATDIDPAAIEVSRDNCLRNGVYSNVTLKAANGIPSNPATGKFDLVTANILAKPLISLAPTIRASLRIGGFVILGGFLKEQSREVIACYLAKGFAKAGIITTDGWTTAVLRRTS